MANSKRDKLLKRGLLTEKKEQLEILKIKADGLIKNIRYELFEINGIESIDVVSAEVYMRELVQIVRQIKELKEEIKKIEEELA